jgi:hypothetical protein
VAASPIGAAPHSSPHRYWSRRRGPVSSRTSGGMGTQNRCADPAGTILPAAAMSLSGRHDFLGAHHQPRSNSVAAPRAIIVGGKQSGRSYGGRSGRGRAPMTYVRRRTHTTLPKIVASSAGIGS